MATKRGKKNKPKRRKRAGAAAGSTATRSVNTRRAFQRARDAFYEHEDPDKALALLQQIEDQGNMSTEVMNFYLDILHELRELDHYARIATVLAERSPENPDAVMVAASGAYATMQPISAILFFERFLQLAPKHPGAPMAEKELAKLRNHLPEFLDAFVDDLPKDLPRIASVEKILHVFKLGRFDDVTRRAKRHLQTYPTDQRIRNNLAESLALQSEHTQALRIVDGTLDQAPNNFFARAVRCRLMHFKGHADESRADAEKLTHLQPRQLSDLTKAAQSFAFIGDEDKIGWAYEYAQRQKWLSDSPIEAAVLTSYFATSLARAGEMRSAKRLWKRAVKLTKAARMAQENMNDLRQPRGERSGPAYFELRDWISSSQQGELQSICEIANRLDEDNPANQVEAAIAREHRRFLKRHPEVERAIPDMLDRGDVTSQKLALLIAPGSQRPPVKQALLNYVHGPRGTDEMRRQLLMSLKKQGYHFESPIKFYSNGKVDQIELLSFEITDEPSVPEGRTDEISMLIEDATHALHNGDGSEAERLLRQVQQIESEQPDVLNNLAMALQIQDRMDEANRLIDEVIRKYPDYFFGKISAAMRLLNQKQFEPAHEILVDLQRRPTLHRTEFVALAKSMVYACVGRAEKDSAQYWLNMLAEYVPGHPEIPSLRCHISANQWTDHLIVVD